MVYSVWPLQTSMSLSQEISLLSVLSHLVKEIIIFYESKSKQNYG